MEMRLNADVVGRYGITVKNLVATGGGANSDAWLQIKADVQGVPVKKLRSAEGGLCGCAMLQAVAMRGIALQEAKKIFVRYTGEFTPEERRRELYSKRYERYKKLYKTVKEFI